MTTPTEVCYYGPCAGGGYHGGWETCEKCAPPYACTTPGCSANDCPNCRNVAALQEVIRQLRVELDDARGHAERLVAARDGAALRGAPPAEHIAALARDLQAFGNEEDGAPPVVVMRARARQAARVLAALMRIAARPAPAPDDAAALVDAAVDASIAAVRVDLSNVDPMRAISECDTDALYREFGRLHRALAAARAREGAARARGNDEEARHRHALDRLAEAERSITRLTEQRAAADEELKRLRAYRDEQEQRIRALPGSKVFEQADADYLRVLASYGSRVVHAAWLKDMACRVEATLAALRPARDDSTEVANG
jgi:hypothetical protein